MKVRPTGDADRDTRNLQQALHDLSVPTCGTSYEFGCVELDGIYSINQPLTCGGSGLKIPSIVGRDAVIFWRGDPTDQPMLTMGTHESGSDRSHQCCMSGVLLMAMNTARGLRLHRQTYRRLLDRVYVYQSRQIGVDLIDCWGGSVDTLSVMQAHGLAVRTSQFNAGSISHLRVHAYPDDFPAADDVTVLNYAGQPVQTSEQDRAALVHRGSNSVLRNLTIESTHFASLPLVNTACRTRLEVPYFEDNHCQQSQIVVQGDGNVSHDRVLSIVDGVCSLSGDNRCQSYVELRGRTYDVRVDGCVFRGLSRSVIHAESGTHYGPVVTRCASYADPIPDECWVSCGPEAVVQAAVPEVMLSVRI